MKLWIKRLLDRVERRVRIALGGMPAQVSAIHEAVLRAEQRLEHVQALSQLVDARGDLIEHRVVDVQQAMSGVGALLATAPVGASGEGMELRLGSIEARLVALQRMIARLSDDLAEMSLSVEALRRRTAGASAAPSASSDPGNRLSS